MPQVELLYPLYDRDGKPIMETDACPLCLRSIIFKILDAHLPDDQHGVGKLRLAQLGIKIAAAKDSVNLTGAETTLIIERAAQLANALVFGQVVAALDPGQFTQA